MKLFFKCCLLIILLSDITYSFIQHTRTQLDGDIAPGVIPTKEVLNVLEDPFGFKVLIKNEFYSNPNRFFSYWFMHQYLNTVPFFFQIFINPIESIYLSIGLIKTCMQILIIYLLASLTCGERKLSTSLIISAALVTPLFQTSGYSGYMGIIDHAPSYFFFYSLPFAILLFLLQQIYFTIKNNQQPSVVKKFILIFLSITLPFSGPLIPGIVLVLCILFLFTYFIKRNLDKSTTDLTLLFKDQPGFIQACLLLILILSVYSLYLGTHNTLYSTDTISLFERYKRLPAGIYYLITEKLGWPLLITSLIINYTIIKRFQNPNIPTQRILFPIHLIIIFSALYIFFLPFGGYRFYRPNIIRCDTIMPVTVSLIFCFGYTTFYLLNKLKKRRKYIYTLYVLIVLLIYTMADKPKFKRYECERNALQQISESPEKIVKLQTNCTIMSWDKIHYPEESRLNSTVLKYWGIIKDDKLYFQSK